jgi:arginine deiminase
LEYPAAKGNSWLTMACWCSDKIKLCRDALQIYFPVKRREPDLRWSCERKKMLRNEGESLKRVVVCSPKREYARAGNFENHNIGELGNPEVAILQHGMLKSKLSEFGAEVIDIPELDKHPNSVFTRDTALCTPRGYIKLRLGLESRQGEGEWMAATLDSLGESCVGEIKANLVWVKSKHQGQLKGEMLYWQGKLHL